jgi:hypothetical protein
VDGAWRRMPDHCSDPDSGLCWLGLLARASRQGKQLRKAACLHDQEVPARYQGCSQRWVQWC